MTTPTLRSAPRTPERADSGSPAAEWWRRQLSGGGATILLATLVLFALSPVLAPGSLGSAPLLSMLPFASVLALVAAGQTLVVQQRGLDLSVPGMIALAAAVVTVMPQNHGWPLWLAVICAVAAPGVVGLVNGLIVAVGGVMPLVVTLGMNAVLLGTVFKLANGTPAGAPTALNRFALDRSLGIPNTLIIAVVVVGVAGLVTRRSIAGHRLTYTGLSAPAAAVNGVRVTLYQVLAYGFAGLAYGGGGVLLAGYTKTPPLFLGDSYLLPSVAAVVLGGTALTGGLASLVSSGIAALFLTQLGQLLRSLGWQDSQQLIAQAVVLVAVVLLREAVPVLAHRVRRWRESPVRSVPA
ncbi:ABC transporter permease [Nocardioides panacihumi]|uniref:ABC transporter permease n=1 Tax=Nocardioides panacihumi TaxID=400774 RepID=A0ABN2QMX9_9ACTN